jgi:inosine/guanosine/xanthosine phosphorylase family protein
MSESAFLKVSQSVSFLKTAFQNVSPQFKPQTAVVLGSGLADALPDIDSLASLKFSEVPGFVPTDVHGHRSEIRFGHYHGAQVVFLRGRNHAYEGFTPAQVVHNVRAMASLDIPNLILTNAAGCLRSDWPVGSLMLVQDHINFTGLNPLCGSEVEQFSRPRFLDMNNCYHKETQLHIESAARKLNIKLFKGVYLGVLGPSYETAAEVAMMAKWGASAVGMSTVLEAIAAHHLGVKVGVVSCLTNWGAGLGNQQSLSHQDVLEVGKKSAASLAELVIETLKRLEGKKDSQ